MFGVGGRLDEGPAALAHFLAADRQKAVDMDPGRQLEFGGMEHAGPEEGVEVGDVLADEMMNLAAPADGGGTFRQVPLRPPIVELLAGILAPLCERRHVANGGVEPDVPVITGAIGDFEAEVRSRAADVPVAERLSQEVPFEVVG